MAKGQYQKTTLVLIVVITFLVAGAGVILAQRAFNGDHKIPPKVYFGEPATAADLLIEATDATSISLIGKWAVESVEDIPAAPAANWLEKPAIAYISFEVRDGEVILTGYSGCNGFGGTTFVLDGRLHTPELVSTARLCGGDPLLQQETALLRILSSPKIWTTVQTQELPVVTIGTEKIGFIQLRKI